MSNGRTILFGKGFELTIDRLCHQLIENYDRFENTCLIGIQTGGVLLSDRIYKNLNVILDTPSIVYGKLDITFYRDDFRKRPTPLKASSMEMDFLIEDKRVILIDDVLYTGRSVQAALSALSDFGRPASVELLTLVDRRFNRHLPIQADYIGMTVDALDEAYVKVQWVEHEGEDKVLLFGEKKDPT